MEKSEDFEEALNLTGYGKFNVFSIILAGVLAFTYNVDTYSIGFLLPAISCDLKLDTFYKGILGSISMLGLTLSSYLWGYLADKRGRKNIIICTLLASFVCTLIASFCSSIVLLLVARFFSGFFLAAPIGIMFPYLGEMEPMKNRARSITITGLFIAAAVITLPAFSWLILPQRWVWKAYGMIDYKPWRLFMVLCACPAIFVACALIPFPESPKYLLHKGKSEEALRILRRIYSINTGQPEESFPVKQLKELSIESEEETNCLKSIVIQTIPLFKRPHLVNILVVCSIQFGLFAVSSGMFIWYPNIVNQISEGSNNNNSLTVCEAITFALNLSTDGIETCNIDSSVFKQNLIIGIAYLIGFCFVVLTIKKIGKRYILGFYLIISGSSGVALCWVSSALVINSLFVGFLVLSGICCHVMIAVMVEMFPTKLRATSVGITFTAARFGSIVASASVGLLLECNCSATIFTFALMMFVCCGLSFKIPNHTKASKSEIHECIT